MLQETREKHLSKFYVDPSRAFFFADGSRIMNLFELVKKLKFVSPTVFRKHVSDHKNDFAYWVKSSFDLVDLAEQMEKAKTSEDMAQIVEDYIKDSHDKEKPSPAPPKKQVKIDLEKPKDFKPSKKEPKIKPEAFMPKKEPKKEDSLSEFAEPAPDVKPKKKSPLKIPGLFEEEENGVVAELPLGSPIHKRDLPPKESMAEEIVSEEDVKKFSLDIKKLRREINKIIIGQEDIIERILLTLMCDGHALLEGVPGLAKSLLVEVLSRVIGSEDTISRTTGTTFRRIQFLPDMLPSDVIGGQIYNPQSNQFITVKGPIFANFILADEINRAPPKTHAALMEAMQERKINIEKDVFILDRPFLVLATQNPLETKGTYALPEAVLDRFMLKINLGYPKRKDEIQIITENVTTKEELVKKNVNFVISKEEFLDLQKKVKKVYLSKRIREYILDIVEATRGLNPNIEGIKFVKYGAGVRASIYLGVGAKAKAIMDGRNYVMPQDINYVAKDVLRHRIALNFKGKAHNISPDKIIDEVLAKVNAV
jgi:MoxR-like ATPase